MKMKKVVVKVPLSKVNDEIKKRLKDFPYEKRFEIGPAESPKGTIDNNVRTVVKYPFFGLIASLRGWKQAQFKGKDTSCPDYVEWGIPWKGKVERLALTDGGFYEKSKKDPTHPYAFMVIRATTPELLTAMRKLYEKSKEGTEALTNFLRKEYGAPENIRGKAFYKATHYNTPREEFDVVKDKTYRQRL